MMKIKTCILAMCLLAMTACGTEAGSYHLSGKLSSGQIAVDLGEDAKKDPEAIVTLVLDNVDITCEVAPAVIFYNVYECGNDDAEQATKDVDTSKAGANVIIADGSANEVHGSYVERIYKPDSVVLNEDKTEVEEAKKLHKYDGAFYSRMSMNISGEKGNTGVLNIFAENEGLDTEMHLSINGGNINIQSGNDGINTNEDGVSVTTINGGSVTAYSCSNSADAGIDSDMGIHINGGTVMATGHMLDHIEEGGQTYVVFNFAQEQGGNEVVSLKNESGNAIMEISPSNAYSILVYSSAHIKEGMYTLWIEDEQLAGSSSGNMMMGGPGMMGRPGMQGVPEMPDGKEFPGGQMPGGQMPEGFPEGFEGKQPPEDEGGNWKEFENAEVSVVFSIKEGANMFNQVGVNETTELESVVFFYLT